MLRRNRWGIESEERAEIARDEHGVPHVRAANERDLYRGLGYCHGRDRGLQLLLTRILVSGRAAEHLEASDEMLTFDRFFRRMNFGGGAQAELAKVHSRERSLADAYVDGVNQAFGHRRPWETRLLRYRPEPWTVADSIAISRAMGYVQVAQHQADMERLLVEMVQAGVPRRHLEELFPRLLDGLDISLLEQVRLGERFVPESVRWRIGVPRAIASNNWAISAAKSASGHPILASDPHLEANRLPAVWYETVLETPDRFCIGASVPGLPFVAVGRTNELAWAPTYACMDAIDSWVEECRDGCFRRLDGGEESWQPFRARTEVVARKKAPDVMMTFYENQHGVLDGDPHDPGLYLATRWSAAADSGAASLAAGFGVLAADDVEAGMSALGGIETAWNWVLADRHGEIAYQMSGKMPRRRAEWSGLPPVAGWDPANDWQGFVGQEELPRARSPECGFIVTANHDLNHFGKSHPVNLPMGADRAERIAEVLEGSDSWTVHDVQRMQMDVYSRHAARFMDVLAPLLPGGKNADTLKSWDCRYDHDSRGAYLFERFYRGLVHAVFGGVLGADVLRFLTEETGVLAGFYANFDPILLDQNSAWFGAQGRDAAFRRAAEHALTGEARPWGAHQRFTMTHLMLGGRLPRWLGFDHGPLPLQGGRATIHQGQIFRLGGRETTWAPSFRLVTDLGEAAAHSTLAGGPSDRRFSRWYTSDVVDWLAGRFKRLTPTQGHIRARPATRSPLARFAHQLAHPSGRAASVVAAWLNVTNTGFNRRAIDALDLAPDDCVLDVGFGGGAALADLLRRSPSRTVAGLEPSAAMIERAARRFQTDIASGRLVLAHASAERLPFPDQSFDALLSVHTSYFFTDRAVALGEMQRVLKPGGRLVLAIWTPERMRKLPATRHGFDLISPGQLATLAADAGLHDVRYEARGHEALIHGRA